MENKIKSLEKNQKLQSYLIIALSAIITWLCYKNFNSSKSDDILYAKGIVIVDEQGRDRVLIGAPIPKSKDRIRDDYDKAMKAWSGDFAPEYKEWYKTYNHDNFGMLILDEKGYDRLAIGSPTPDPNIGKRLGSATGIEINDERGFERSGYGLMKVNGKNRVVLGLDRDNGTEGLSLMVSDEGNSGLIMQGKTNIFLGKTETKNWYTKEFPFNGLIIENDSLKTNLKFNALNEN